MKINKKTTHKSDTWLQKYWRPMMAVTYMVIVIFDFIIGPIFWTTMHAIYTTTGDIGSQWTPLTLVAGGVFHAAMGAILGISAYTRGQEKINRLVYGSQEQEDNDNQTNINNSVETNNVGQN